MPSCRSLAALVPVMPAAGAAAALDPTLEAIAKADAAHRRWEAVPEPSLVLTIADQELDAAHDAVLATTPTTLAGIAALIAWAKREHYLDDEPADLVAWQIERAIAGMVGPR